MKMTLNQIREKLEKARVLVESGMPLNQVAAATGLAVRTVKRHFRSKRIRRCSNG